MKNIISISSKADKPMYIQQSKLPSLASTSTQIFHSNPSVQNVRLISCKSSSCSRHLGPSQERIAALQVSAVGGCPSATREQLPSCDHLPCEHHLMPPSTSQTLQNCDCLQVSSSHIATKSKDIQSTVGYCGTIWHWPCSIDRCTLSVCVHCPASAQTFITAV